MSTLLLDIGNTNTGFVCSENYTSLLSIPTEEISTKKLIHDFIHKYKTTKIIIASVVPNISNLFAEACNEKEIKYKNITFNDIPLRTTLDNNGELGIDRAINAFYGMEKFGNNVVIVDFGTALTFDIIDNGVYQGGMIFPGISMAMHNLHTKTAKLPSVKITEFSTGIGKNTIDAITFGCTIGYEGVLKNTISFIKNHYQTFFATVFTGGSGQLFYHLIEGATFEENLILEYLYRKYGNS